MKYYILDEDHNPIETTMTKFASRYEKFSERRVKLDSFPDPETKGKEVRVSTVFLGIDHNFLDPGNPPILFETMVFGGKYEDYQERYATWQEAEEGHEQIVRKVKQAIEKGN